MWCWTRLADGDRAHKIMMEMLTQQGFENGLTYQHASYHWEREDLQKEGDLFCHFQLDGSAAVPGCIAEMLLQSHMGEIHLLPALPKAWPDGKISGLKARGGHRINISWKEGRLVKASLESPHGVPTPAIRLKDQLIDPGTDPRITIL
jgi:alpha-L-fucosidase 2